MGEWRGRVSEGTGVGEWGGGSLNLVGAGHRTWVWGVGEWGANTTKDHSASGDLNLSGGAEMGEWGEVSGERGWGSGVHGVGEHWGRLVGGWGEWRAGMGEWGQVSLSGGRGLG